MTTPTEPANPGMFCDHSGKTSQARVASLISTIVGCTIAAGPLWGGPEPSIELVLALLIGPSGLTLWQKLQAEREKPHADE